MHGGSQSVSGRGIWEACNLSPAAQSLSLRTNSARIYNNYSDYLGAWTVGTKIRFHLVTQAFQECFQDVFPDVWLTAGAKQDNSMKSLFQWIPDRLHPVMWKTMNMNFWKNPKHIHIHVLCGCWIHHCTQAVWWWMRWLSCLIFN